MPNELRVLTSLVLSAATFVVPRSAPAQAHPTTHVIPTPSVRAMRVQGKISIDGRLDEAAWAAATPATGFRQRQPAEGQLATQKTEVRFLFDEDALYVGARMYDSLGARGVTASLVRRDKVDLTTGDYLELIFDTFHDHLGRTLLRVNPSGSRRDASGPGGAPPDDSWDPVYQVVTNVDSLGWTAEFRIPLSQLRYPNAPEQSWGIEIWRFVSRLNEFQMYSFWTSQEISGPARFGHLEGLVLPSRAHSVEFTPYLVGSSAYVRPADSKNPFLKSNERKYRAGADVKYLLTSNLTLDAAVLPDFGQVEVDPAVINLTAFETFYPEKRNFFIEGAGLFSFGTHGCFFCEQPTAPPDQFYPRRIGRAPQGVASGTYVRAPDHTDIITAAKITGRTAGGISVGILDALTAAEHADVMTVSPAGAQTRSRTEVEPRTNYFIGRTKKDFHEGNTVIGAFTSSVIRAFREQTLASRLPKDAEVGGVDLKRTWHQKTYLFTADYALSRVAGTPASLLRIQHSSARYFQRPDRSDHGGLFSTRFDSGRTSLTGYRGFARLAKEAGVWEWEAQVDARSPGFESNDLSFLPKADYIWAQGNFTRWVSTPTALYRNYFAVVGGERQQNYSGDLTYSGMHAAVYSLLANYWTVDFFVIRSAGVMDDRLTRGGPAVRATGRTFARTSIHTDARRTISWATTPSYQVHDDGARGYTANLEMVAKLLPNLQLTLSPTYSYGANASQFLLAAPDTSNHAFSGKRYVFGYLRQRTASLATRVAYTLSPTASFEAFAQPFIVGGNYSRYQEFVSPREGARHVFADSQITRYGNGASRVDSIRVNTAQVIGIRNPDFTFRSLRGNAIFRWEYRPGSTLFLVWQQTREDSAPLGDLRVLRDGGALFSRHPDNIFQLKISYWLSR